MVFSCSWASPCGPLESGDQKYVLRSRESCVWTTWPLPWFSLAFLSAAQTPPSPGSWVPSSACTISSGRITRSTSSSLSSWSSSSSSWSSSSTPCQEPSVEGLSWAHRRGWSTRAPSPNPLFFLLCKHMRAPSAGTVPGARAPQGWSLEPKGPEPVPVAKSGSAFLGGDGKGAVPPYPNPCHHCHTYKL